jgi:CarD family transcriptional regulator
LIDEDLDEGDVRMKATQAKAKPAPAKSAAAKKAAPVKTAATKATPVKMAAAKTAASKTAAPKTGAAKAAPTKAEPPKAAAAKPVTAKAPAEKQPAAKAAPAAAKPAPAKAAPEKAAATKPAPAAAPQATAKPVKAVAKAIPSKAITAKEEAAPAPAPVAAAAPTPAPARAPAAAPTAAAPRPSGPPRQAMPTSAASSEPAPSFSVGDHVVYPTHGVGRVTGVVNEEIAGHKLTLIVIEFEENRMVLRVPVAKARSAGLRKLSTRKAIDTALATLKGRARIKRTMWSRRAQEYEAKINSGDPVAIAEVVRDLHRNAGQPDQSFSERQIYEQAMDRLAAELAAIDGIDKPAAQAKLATVLKAA